MAIVTTACGALAPFSGASVPTPGCFDPGTPLIFEGRTTTAALGVQEVVGDPMSHVPADISITRDEFDQGDQHGRLVCAIYTDPEGFVEVTVVPEGWELGAARPPDPPTPEPTPVPERPSAGITQADAITIARRATKRGADAAVASVRNGPAGEVLTGLESLDWVAAVPGDGWLWLVTFRFGNGEGTTVLIDYVEGTVYGSLDWIE